MLLSLGLVIFLFLVMCVFEGSQGWFRQVLNRSYKSVLGTLFPYIVVSPCVWWQMFLVLLVLNGKKSLKKQYAGRCLYFPDVCSMLIVHMLSVLPTLHSGLGLLAMGNCSSTRQVLSCFPQLACDVERHALYLSLLLPFAIVHFLVRFCKKWWFLRLQPACWLRHAFFLHTLVSYCAIHDTNLWRPLTIAIFGSFDQACILTAHAWLERCLNGNKKQSMHQLIWLRDSSLCSTTPG